MGDLLLEHMLQDLRIEVKAMSRQLDNMNKDIQEIKRQLAEKDKQVITCNCDENDIAVLRYTDEIGMIINTVCNTSGSWSLQKGDPEAIQYRLDKIKDIISNQTKK